MKRTDPQIEADIRKLEILLQNTTKELTTLDNTVNGIAESMKVIQDTQTETPSAPVANLLWDGEIGHSVNSWHDTSYVVNDTARENSWGFSHNKPAAPETFVDADVNTGADRVNIPGHTFTTGQTVDLLNTGGALPAGLATGTIYYLNVSGDDIGFAGTIANAEAGTLVNITAAAGGGTHTIQERFITTDARTSATNNKLKAPSHSTYNLRFTDWDSATGEARLTGTKTFDTMLPSNFIDATLGNVYLSFILARRNQYIDIPSTARLFAGIWDSTDGQRDWLTGTIGLAGVAEINGASTIERRYRIFVQTDRGYSILSPEVTVLNAPDDGQYDGDNFVTLTWRATFGYLYTEIWMFTPSTGVYRRLNQSSSGNFTYIDNGAFENTDTGYPTATSTERKAVFFTPTGNISSINVDGSPWDTMFAPIGIPNNYDKSLTTDRQILRIGLTEAPDLLIPGITTDGTATIIHAEDVFEAEYDTIFDSGTLACEVYDEDEVLIDTAVVLSRTDQKTLVLDKIFASGADRIIRIIGAGFHGLLIDKIHLGFQRNVSYAPNALDARVLQPVAAPSGSTQGGPGTGGTGGGGTVCVELDTPIQLANSEFEYEAETIATILREFRKNIRRYLKGENIDPNLVCGMQTGIAPTRLVRTRNGFWKRCTNTHTFRLHMWDQTGTPLFKLRVGDRVATSIDGRDELSELVEIGELGRPVSVAGPKLLRGHYYVAGSWRPTWWQKILIALKLRKPSTGGIYAHNEKPEPGNEF
jgi:hypothetical protein